MESILPCNKMKLNAQIFRRKMKGNEKLDPVFLVDPESYLPGQLIVRQCGDVEVGFQVTNCIGDCP